MSNDISDPPVGRQPSMATQERTARMIADYTNEYIVGAADPLKPYVGAKPKFLKEPSIATARETEAATKLACRNIFKTIKDAPNGVLLIMAQDASYSPTCRKLLDAADDRSESAPTSIVLGNDWLHTLPHTEKLAVPPCGDRLLIFVGTPGKYLAMVMKSTLQGDFDDAYAANRLIVVTMGAIMMPLGSQEQNVFGADPERVLEAILSAVDAKGGLRWGHGAGTKAGLMEHAFHHLPKWHVPVGSFGPPPTMLSLADAAAAHKPEKPDETFNEFDSFACYVKFANALKLAQPSLPVLNYWDAGLLVSIVQGYSVEAGAGLLTDRDGLAMLRDTSIGHIMSKLHQVAHVQPLASRRAVYNFFIGDGAARLNCGMETAFHVLESYKASAFITLFVFNNQKWAIEDNLVADTELEHMLFNTQFYDTLGAHPAVQITNSLAELHACLAELSAQQNDYAMGKAGPQMKIVVVRGLDAEVPVLLGDIDPIRKSPEMELMKKALGAFAAGCESKVPLYGCSAFEYIQHLKLFLDETPEGKLYQYTCGRTDIQAAHMCGFEQPEGRCVLFINDVYGVNSLGEALRMVQSGLGGKQLLVFVWHPSLLKVSDHFHLHRPPMVWPSLGPTLAAFYVRKEADGCFVDFDGEHPDETADTVKKAIDAKTPLIMVNMLPEQERGYVALDIRARMPAA